MAANYRSTSLQLVVVALVALAAVMTLATAPAQAEDGGPAAQVPAKATAAAVKDTAPADPDPWRISATAYAWLMGVTGSTTVRGQVIDTNASFIDIVQKSDSLAAFMAYAEFAKGPASFYTDFVFTRLGFGAAQTNYRNPLPGLRITTSANAALTYQLFVIEMGGTYEVHRWVGSDGGKSFTAIDLLGGYRYWNNAFSASFDGSTNADFSRLDLQRSFGFSLSATDTVQWVDPIVGVRLRHQFTPRQAIFVRGDIGGFGLGSQLTWQGIGAYSYRWQFTGYDIAAVVGFRALGVNYSNPGQNAVGINEILYGPIIGATVRF